MTNSPALKNARKLSASAMASDADNLKSQAKRLRAALSDRDIAVSHSMSLELLAQSYGFRDWNTAIAMTTRQISISVSDLAIGRRFAGSYLGNAVTGEIRGLQHTAVTGVWRIEVHLDVPVDVSETPRMKIPRQRIASRINKECEPVLVSGQRGPGLSVDLLL